MATGHDINKSFGADQWGAYGKGKRFGAIDMSSTHNRTFSLTQANSRYIDTVTKGHRSAAVNRAIEVYRGAGLETHDLVINIANLQKVIQKLYAEQELHKVPGSSEIADDEANHVSPGWVRRLILHLKRSFHL